MNRKMIFFDIDGTLLPEGSTEVPQSTREALLRAQARGHLLFINTGRTHFNIDPFIRELNFDGYVCGCGTYIYYRQQQLLAHTIPHRQCVELVMAMRRCRIPGFYEENDHIYFDTEATAPEDGRNGKNSTAPGRDILKNARRLFGTKAYDIPKDIHDPTFTFDKILAFIQPDSDVLAFTKYSEGFLEFIDRGNQVAEIIPKGYSKATGIRFLCDYLHIPLSDCYAIGDSTNDLSMLEYVPHSIAMGNSDPGVKERCSYVTADVRHDGIYHALEHFGLI